MTTVTHTSMTTGGHSSTNGRAYEADESEELYELERGRLELVAASAIGRDFSFIRKVDSEGWGCMAVGTCVEAKVLRSYGPSAVLVLHVESGDDTFAGPQHDFIPVS